MEPALSADAARPHAEQRSPNYVLHAPSSTHAGECAARIDAETRDTAKVQRDVEQSLRRLRQERRSRELDLGKLLAAGDRERAS